MRVYVTVVLAALMLAGCGLPPTVFRTDRNSKLLAAPPLQETAIGGIFIAPVENANADSLAFRRRLARSLGQQEVAAGIDVAGTYSAKLLSAAAPAALDGKGYVDVWWRLEGPDGAIWDAFSTPTPLDFRVERGETITVINAITARVVYIMRPFEPAPRQAIPPLVVAVPPAKTQGFDDGGPLSRAMAAQLAARGMQPGEKDAANAVIHAHAAIERVKAGDQKTVQIQIRWTVVDKAGLVLGIVNQKNKASLATINAGLAALAPDAAGAAADAVADLVRKARPAVTAQQSTGQVKQ